MIALYHYRHDIDMNGIAYSYDELHRATFAPLPHDELILDRVGGKTYQEKKEAVRDKAIDYSYMMGVVTNMAWGDSANVSEWFHRYGKRFGLLREFHENGIC